MSRRANEFMWWRCADCGELKEEGQEYGKNQLGESLCQNCDEKQDEARTTTPAEREPKP